LSKERRVDSQHRVLRRRLIRAFVGTAIGAWALLCHSGVTAATGTSSNRVVTQVGSGIYLAISAPRHDYPRGALVPVMVEMWNQSRFGRPFRWGCGRFAQVHVIGNHNRDLGVAPLARDEPTCSVPSGGIGILRPYHRWSETQHVWLRRPRLDAEIVPLVHNVDESGMVDVPILTNPLTFALLP
jgi:hypothetical protein